MSFKNAISMAFQLLSKRLSKHGRAQVLMQLAVTHGHRSLNDDWTGWMSLNIIDLLSYERLGELRTNAWIRSGDIFL